MPIPWLRDWIELSEDNILKSLFDDKKDPIKVLKTGVDYSRLRQHARQMLSSFGRTSGLTRGGAGPPRPHIACHLFLTINVRHFWGRTLLVKNKCSKGV